MTENSGKIDLLILGIGNLIMSDDGIGVRVIRKLRENYIFPELVTLLDGGTLGLDLLPALEGRSHLVIVDAVETGGKPGEIVRLTGSDIPVAIEHKLSPHQMGVKDLLAVSALMGHEPAEIVMLGIQPGSIEMGENLTEEIEKKLDELCLMVLEELERTGIRFSAKSTEQHVDFA